MDRIPTRYQTSEAGRRLYLWSRYLGLDDGALVAGSSTICAPPYDWTPHQQWSVVWLLSSLLTVAQAAGLRDSWRVTSLYRCPSENRRRGGVPGSRHQLGEGEGLPYAAIDVALSDADLGRVAAIAYQVPDIVRAAGWDGGVGIIVYPTSIHLDLREGPSYVDVRWRA